MIGSMTPAVIAAAFVGLLDTEKSMASRASSAPIAFEGSASGLRKGGSVNFDGVQVEK
jgi:phospholipid/cholesterol/gamma-HCH transport system substrate-binding protein